MKNTYNNTKVDGAYRVIQTNPQAFLLGEEKKAIYSIDMRRKQIHKIQSNKYACKAGGISHIIIFVTTVKRA